MPSFAALDRLKADLDILRPLDPEQEARVLQKFRLDWNYHSNAIEGNALTLGETRSLLLHGITAQNKPLRDHLDIRGHNEAVLALEDIVRQERPLTEQFIREMHQVLLGEPYDMPSQTPEGLPTRKHIVPGQYKSLPNGVFTATGEMLYFARPDETPVLMTDLVAWYRAEEEAGALHPVALAAAFHYRFVRIHPFDDGNGRMARLLMNLILMRRGYPITVIHNEDRNNYLAGLEAANAGDLEPFTQFIAESVVASLQLMLRAARGESIEEPSDLDKKLALLKVEVSNLESPRNNIWNLQTQTTFYDALIKFWLSDLSSEVERYDIFFVNQGVTFIVHDLTNDWNSNEIKKLKEAHAFAKRSFDDSYHKFDEMLFIFSWNEFKKKDPSFNVRLVVEFRFHESVFAVRYAVHDGGLVDDDDDTMWSEIFESPYKVSYEYDHAQIQALNHQLTNKVYDFIAAKMQEPPAA